MSNSKQAPIVDPMIDDNRKCRPSWVEYFGDVSLGDVGTSFTPTFTGLGTTGVPTISGVYYQNQGLTYFAVKIVPGTDTSSTFGTTTFTLPFNVVADTACNAVVGISVAQGVINAAGKTVFTPTWTNIAVPVTITGYVKS